MVANVVEIQAENAQVAELHRVFKLQQQAYRQKPMPSADERIAHLAQFKRVLLKYTDDLAQAASDDFGHRSLDETKFAEILTTLEGLKYYQKNVRKWMRPEKRHVGAMQLPATAKVFFQPLGVVGVIVPWNYPIFLATGPLMCALAAGNRVMIKMSGFTPRVGETVKKMLAEAFPEDHVAV
ncbi:MAG: aldehyde dehydrogenase family protein, partial [Moraxellaceae bacterium]|nr:aldehyde dehydrogenase family protein [Moraxellaceae bacterium]